MIVAVRDFITDLVNTFLTVVRMFFFTRPVKSVSQIKSGSEAVILANGPSLTGSIIKYREKFIGKDLYCVNNFAMTELYSDIKPGYYVLTGPEYWMNKVGDLYITMREELFRNLIEKTTWKLHLLIPVRARGKKIIESLSEKNSNIHIHYYNTCPVEGLRCVNHFFYSSGIGMPRPHNVLIPTLMLTVRNRYKNVYVFGADHTWLDKITVNDKNEALVDQQHFYDSGSSKPGVMYMLGQRPRRLFEILHKLMLAFRAYFDILEYSRKKRVKIVNCTPGSLIDAFDRGEMD